MVPLSHAIMSESVKCSIKGIKKGRAVSTQGLTMESITMDKPDACFASDDEHLGSRLQTVSGLSTATLACGAIQDACM